MDISEVWRHLGYFLVPLLALFCLVISKRISKVWLRRTARVFSSLFLALSTLVLMLDGCGLVGCTARKPALVSPDGKHVAIVTWGLQGATGADYARVDVRSRYLPWSTRVYRGSGFGPVNAADPGIPEVTWIDAHHLRVSSQGNSAARILECAARVDDISILCD